VLIASVQHEQFRYTPQVLQMPSLPSWYVQLFVCLSEQLTIKDADSGSGRTAKTANVGDNDASPDNTPSQFLLLRGLEPSVTEELLAKGVAKLYKPSGAASQPGQPVGKKGAKVASTTGDSNLGAKEGTLRRILLVRDRKTNDSWRYGFAEFAAVEDAQAALTRYNSFDKFTIASKPVMASYVHAGVFVPVLNPSAGVEKFTFSPMANPALKLKYWDEEAYVTELVVSPVETDPKDESLVVKAAAMAAESENIRSIKESDKTKKRKAETLAGSITSSKKAAPSQLQFWSNRHAELHGIEQKGSDNGDGVGSGQGSPTSSERADVPPMQSYADPKRNCCYLCSRQFKTLAEMNRHERLSDLHRQNLNSEELVAKARKKLEKHNVQPQQTNVEYRDRAKERRKAFGVVNKKGEIVQSASKASKASSDEEDTPPINSKGASMLGKMGYTAGQGLGASGSGMMAPINQDVYMAGVGLGAQGGKLGDAVIEAARNTKGDYSGFAERTREGARERYGRM
jgi:RNA recognition motif-containing protein